MMGVTFPVQRIQRVKTRTALIGQGQRMSNWLFNIAHEADLPERYRNEANMLRMAWDAIIRDGTKEPPHA